MSAGSAATGRGLARHEDTVTVLPGTLPVMNRGAVERAIEFGLAIGAHVAPRSIFARKNYFYPDLPKGYQISQYEIPVVQGGEVILAKGGRDIHRGGSRMGLEHGLQLAHKERPVFRKVVGPVCRHGVGRNRTAAGRAADL